MSNIPSAKRLCAVFALGAGLAVCALAAYTWLTQPLAQAARPGPQMQAVQSSQAGLPRLPSARADTVEDAMEGDWQVGQMRPGGLRIRPSGYASAADVLDPEAFARPKVRRAYAMAREIPATINKHYCWCGCENRGVHRSNLACFEDRMAVNCAVCRGTAEIAYRMTQEGVTDAGAIQAAVDAEWGPPQAAREQQRRQG